MAERVGFEPTVRLATDNGFRDRPDRPLRHLSIKKNGGEGGIRTRGRLVIYTRFPSVLLKPARTPLRCSLFVSVEKIYLISPHTYQLKSHS